MTAQESLTGLAFPVVRVRFAGPTDTRGARYIASVRGVRVTRSYDYAASGSENALAAARQCWGLYCTRQVRQVEPCLYIPGDLSDDAYCFTVIPAGFFGEES